MPERQRTLAIIKPDAVARNLVGQILQRIESSDMQMVALKMVYLSEDQARTFYAVHEGKPFYETLVRFMASGPLVATCLEGEDAIESWRTLMGKTDPEMAAPNSLRRAFGTTIQRNAVHGSDSPQTAANEIHFFFTGLEVPPPAH